MNTSNDGLEQNYEEQIDQENSQTMKILPPKIETEEGVFARLSVTVEAVFESISIKVAQIAQASIENLTAIFIKVDQLEAGKVKVSAPSVGTITISAGEVTYFVNYEDINNDTKVFLTPEEPVNIGVLIKVAEKGFEIRLSQPQEKDLYVSYWVIN